MCSLSLLQWVAAVLVVLSVSVSRVSVQAQSSVLSAPASTATPGTSTATLCMIFFSQPGRVEHPWTAATSLTVTYNQSTTAPNAVRLWSATGTRVFTNKYGEQVSGNVASLYNPLPYFGNLYVDGTVWDQYGVGLIFNPLVRSFPGTLGGTPTVRREGSYVRESSFIIDDNSTVITSSVPGFVPLHMLGCTAGGSNRNCNNYNTATCTSTISSSNGLVPKPTAAQLQAAAKLSYTYTYYISDGSNWSVTTSLKFTMNATLGFQRTVCGDYYLTVAHATGSRIYNNPLKTVLTASNVLDTCFCSAGPGANQQLYPFALSQQPTVYNKDNAPYLDERGVSYTVDPPTTSAARTPAIKLPLRPSAID